MQLPFSNKVRSLLVNTRTSRSKNTSRNQARLTVEALESRELMSGNPILSPAVGAAVATGVLTGGTKAYLPPPPPAAGVALINSLSDATVRSIALADFSRDFAITRNDMMDIFNRGTLGYTAVTKTCIESLEVLVQISNSAALGMPTYVQNLGYKVVWNSIAPGEDAGQQLNQVIVSQAPIGKPTAGTTTTNGALQVNIKACAQSIEQGVFNYFEGIVLPNATYSYNGKTYQPTWQWFNTMPLFNSGGPNYQDVAQGQANDCWLIASLAEVAARNPTAIENMFVNNGDGTYTVRFYNGTTPDFVTVDTRLPMTPSGLPVAGPRNLDGSPTYAATLYDHPMTCLWVALAEKAYVVENGNGWIGCGTKGVASYAALSADYPSDALAALTGLSTNTTWLKNIPAIYENGDAIGTAWSQGKYVCVCTSAIASGVVPSHCYALVSVSGPLYTFYNPYGAFSITYQGSPASMWTGDATAVASTFFFWTCAGAAPELAGPQAHVVTVLGVDTKQAGAGMNPMQTSPTQNGQSGTGDTAKWEMDRAMLASLTTAQFPNGGVLASLDAAFTDMLGEGTFKDDAAL